MKPARFNFSRLATAGTLGLILAQSAQATTTLTFDGFGTNATIPNTFADNASAAGPGVSVSAGLLGTGTPDIDFTWNTSGLTQFYNSWDGRGSVAQLDYNGNNVITWTLTPVPGAAIKVESFDLDLWNGGGISQIDWSVSGSVSGVLASGSWQRSTGGRDSLTPNATAQSGEAVSLTFTRVSGAASYLALDNLAFDQVPEPASFALGALGLGAAALRRRRAAAS